MARLSLLLLLLLLACGDDDTPPPSSSECPEELGDRLAWSYEGDDAQCEELARALEQSAGTGGDDQCASGELAELDVYETTDGQCAAVLNATCDGRALGLACDVGRDGGGSCRAVFVAPELEAGMCELRLRVY